jgi:GT2 family glycosyltransferase
MSQLGIVAIGRNEGERLRRCLTSVMRCGLPVVYVDSDSRDGSVELARALGVEVVELDPTTPLGMARARNSGFARLCEIDPEIRFVQFVDGDCELIDGWLDQGRRVLEERPDVALVTGRRSERFADASIYNRLADLDWDMPVGEIKGSHGDIMVRADMFREVGGFDPEVLVSEDHELCLRMRKKGWILLRIDAPMTLHDMAMTRFGQWWRRGVRTGYGYADGAYLHGKSPERHCIREVRSVVFWGILLPLFVLPLAWSTRGASLALLTGYLLQYSRIRRYAASRGWSASDARLFAFWCILASFPMAIGLVTYWFRLLAHRPKQIIEYKGLGNGDLDHEPCTSISSERSNANY